MYIAIYINYYELNIHRLNSILEIPNGRFEPEKLSLNKCLDLRVEKSTSSSSLSSQNVRPKDPAEPNSRPTSSNVPPPPASTGHRQQSGRPGYVNTAPSSATTSKDDRLSGAAVRTVPQPPSDIGSSSKGSSGQRGQAFDSHHFRNERNLSSSSQKESSGIVEMASK